MRYDGRSVYTAPPSFIIHTVLLSGYRLANESNSDNDILNKIYRAHFYRYVC